MVRFQKFIDRCW